MKREHPRDAIARLTSEVQDLEKRVSELEADQGFADTEAYRAWRKEDRIAGESAARDDPPRDGPDIHLRGTP